MEINQALYDSISLAIGNGVIMFIAISLLLGFFSLFSLFIGHFNPIIKICYNKSKVWYNKIQEVTTMKEKTKVIVIVSLNILAMIGLSITFLSFMFLGFEIVGRWFFASFALYQLCIAWLFMYIWCLL